MTYATHPFDVVGWDGCLYPYTFNVEDYMPITGKVHQPPPVHQVFEGYNFVICNFLPRKVDYHELAIPVPYYHSNVDSDEVMFYVGGDYEARKGSGINIGSISLHPGGHAHGPQPSAIEASLGVDYFEESAVMVDTFAPLDARRGRARGRGPGVRLDLGRPRAGRRGRRRRRAGGLLELLNGRACLTTPTSAERTGWAWRTSLPARHSPWAAPCSRPERSSPRPGRSSSP